MFRAVSLTNCSEASHWFYKLVQPQHQGGMSLSFGIWTPLSCVRGKAVLGSVMGCAGTGGGVSSDLRCPLLLHLQLSAHCQAVHKERDLAFRVKSAFQTPAPILSRKPTDRCIPLYCRWATAFESSTGSHWKIPVSGAQQNSLDFSEFKKEYVHPKFSVRLLSCVECTKMK